MVSIPGPVTDPEKKPVLKQCVTQKMMCVNVWAELKLPVKRPWCVVIVQTWMHYAVPIPELWQNYTNSDHIQTIHVNFGIMAPPAGTFWIQHTLKRMCVPFKE
jgi:hypothetical protein